MDNIKTYTFMYRSFDINKKLFKENKVKAIAETHLPPSEKDM